MDPITLGLILGGGSSLLNFFGQNKAQNQANKRQKKVSQKAESLLGAPGQGEQAFMDFLMSGFDPASFTSEGFNTGQDALMQMLRAPAIDTNALFDAWTPIEKRALDENLSNFWGTNAGLGQRFGSAAARETGRIRGEAAENATARRAETSVDLAKFNAGQKLTAAQAAQQGGLGWSQLMAQILGQRLAGFGQLAGLEQGRNVNMLNFLAGLPGQGNALTAAGSGLGEFSQLITLLPFLRQLSGGKA